MILSVISLAYSGGILHVDTCHIETVESSCILEFCLILLLAIHLEHAFRRIAVHVYSQIKFFAVACQLA